MAKPDFQLKWAVNRSGGIPPVDPADYQLGWQFRAGLPPLTGNFDYYQNLADLRLLYINEQGISEWDALTAYPENAYVKGSDGNIYRSTAPTTGNDPIAGGPWILAFADTLNTVRQDVASAATTVLPVSTRHVNITGTAAITAFTISAGNCYFVRFAGVATLTNNASIVTQTGANIVTAAGDTCLIRATAANVVEILCYSRVSDLGVGQAWQDLTASRAIGVTYTNGATPISIWVHGTASANNQVLSAVVDGQTMTGTSAGSGGFNLSINIIVPAGSQYTVNNTGGTLTSMTWREMR